MSKEKRTKKDLYLDRDCEDCHWYKVANQVHCHHKCDLNKSGFEPKRNKNYK